MTAPRRLSQGPAIAAGLRPSEAETLVRLWLMNAISKGTARRGGAPLVDADLQGALQARGFVYRDLAAAADGGIRPVWWVTSAGATLAAVLAHDPVTKLLSVPTDFLEPAQDALALHPASQGELRHERL
jgi:hypothetical protein